MLAPFLASATTFSFAFGQGVSIRRVLGFRVVEGATGAGRVVGAGFVVGGLVGAGAVAGAVVCAMVGAVVGAIVGTVCVAAGATVAGAGG